MGSDYKAISVNLGNCCIGSLPVFQYFDDFYPSTSRILNRHARAYGERTRINEAPPAIKNPRLNTTAPIAFYLYPPPVLAPRCAVVRSSWHLLRSHRVVAMFFTLGKRWREDHPGQTAPTTRKVLPMTTAVAELERKTIYDC
jgi:hypothetical protein